MISYYIQLIICVFMFGFGIGSAFYAFGYISSSQMKKAVRQFLREEKSNQRL